MFTTFIIIFFVLTMIFYSVFYGYFDVLNQVFFFFFFSVYLARMLHQFHTLNITVYILLLCARCYSFTHFIAIVVTCCLFVFFLLILHLILLNKVCFNNLFYPIEKEEFIVVKINFTFFSFRNSLSSFELILEY